MVGTHVPGGGATHREAHHCDPVRINGVAALDVSQGFERIDLAGKLAGIAPATIEVQFESVRRGEVALRLEAPRDETHLGQGVAPPVEPKVNGALGAVTG